MRSQSVKARIKRNKWEKQMRLRYGRGWRKYLTSGGIMVVPTAPARPAPTIEEMRIYAMKHHPRPSQPSYIEGVSPNA